jgi:predicted acyltransferase
VLLGSRQGPTPRIRLESLDVFRGLTIAGMILVSTPGTWDAVYPALEHAAWNGWTLADLVFPFLLFAMGAAVPFALARRRGRQSVRRHVMRRAAILFALGLLLNAIETAPPLSLATFRIPGVLQRIALVYLAVSWLTEGTSTRTQIAVATGALVGYWVAITLIPVPGCLRPTLSAECNIGSFIDRQLFGRHMLYPTWDPEGLLSTIPAVATALFGVLAGDWLHAPAARHRTLALFGAGVLAVVIALVWHRVFPINKNLWTSSFALFTAGLAAQVIALCHWLLDIHRWRAWSHPFVAFGRNPLAGYFLSVGLDSLLTRWSTPQHLSIKGFLYRTLFASWLRGCCGTEAASLAYALAYVALWALVLGEMHRRRIYIGI